MKDLILGFFSTLMGVLVLWAVSFWVSSLPATFIILIVGLLALWVISIWGE